MKSIVDRASQVTGLIAAAVMVWFFVGNWDPVLKKLVAMTCLLAMTTAFFARGAFGAIQDSTPRPLTLLGFWVCAVAFVIQTVVLLLSIGSQHVSGA